MKFVSYNFKHIDESQLYLHFSLRALQYGDGIFETIRIHKYQLLWFSLHFKRLMKGFSMLGFDVSSDWQENNLKTHIEALILKNKIEYGRVKLLVYRTGKGLYGSESNDVACIISMEPIDQKRYSLNKTTYKIDFFDAVHIGYSELNAIKKTSAIPYVLCQNFAIKNKLSDAILLNNKDEIVECSSSNIFIRIGKNIYTPPISAGCLDGIMRNIIIDICRKNKISIEETILTKQDIMEANEIFTTNVVKGITSVTHIQHREYEKTTAVKLIILLNERI